MTKYSKCVVEHCGHRQQRNKTCIYAKFPKDVERCRKWLKAVGESDLIYLPPDKLHNIRYVCGCHFTDDQFCNATRKRLKKTAVPSLFNSRTRSLGDDLVCQYPLTPDYNTVRILDNENSNTNLVCAVGCSTSMPLVGDKTTVVHELVEEIPMSSGSMVNNLPLSEEVTEEVANRGDAKRYRPSVATTRISCKKRIELVGMPSGSISPRKKKLLQIIGGQAAELKKKIVTLQSTKDALQKLSSAETFASLFAKISSPLLREMVVADLRNNNRAPTGRRWTMQDKLLAISIYKRSPRAYSYLQHLITLPTSRTIARLLHNIPMDVGINSKILKHLERVVATMAPQDKECIVMFDEMALKQRLVYNECTGVVEGYEDFGTHGRTPNHADHALVYMVQGLGKRFKLPIAYYFCRGTTSADLIRKTLVDVIRALMGIGLHIAATVCDQGPTNRSALNQLKRNTRSATPRTFFEVDGQRVYTIFDPPHLFKSLRNNFMGNFSDWSQKNKTLPISDYPGQSVRWKNQIAKWKHIMDIYVLDTATYKFNKLTYSHVFPTSREKMRVKLAAQTLSNTTAAILRCVCTLNTTLLPHGLLTAQFVSDMDAMFDSMNGPANSKDRKNLQREIVTTTSGHIEQWSNFRKHLTDMQFVRYNGIEFRPPCQNGLITTLSAMQDLWQYLMKKGFTTLNQRHLNQDPLENLFGIIRQHGVTNDNPTCTHFVAALKSTIISNVSAPHSRGSNCENDDGKTMNDLMDFFLEREITSLSPATVEEIVHEKRNTLLNNNVDEITSSYSGDPESPPMFHISDSEDEDLILEEDLMAFPDRSAIYLGNYVVRIMAKKMSCSECRRCICGITPDDALQQYEAEGLIGSLQPSSSMLHTIEVAQNVFVRDIASQMYRADVTEFATQRLMAACDTCWLQCEGHGAIIAMDLYSILIRLFIKQQCKILNYKLKETEVLAKANIR